MNEQELVEQIRRDIDTMIVTRYKLVHQVDTNIDTAQHIMNRIKQAGYVRLLDDQSLPEDPYNYEQECRESTAYGEAQQAIWEAGWRKVEL